MLIGSSPFCGSKQFKEKAPIYFEKFFNNPDNITDLLVHVCNMGYGGAHIIAAAPIAKAVLEAYKILGYKFPVIVTLLAGDEEQWKWIRRMDTVAVFLHAFETDKLEKEDIKKFSYECRKRELIPAVSTHNGGITVPWIDNEGLDIQAYLVPFNKTGAHVHPSLPETLKAIRDTPKTVIGMKILSCGDLTPREAFQYSLPYIDAAAVGMVASEEIDENCHVFNKYHRLLGIKRSTGNLAGT